MAVYSRQLHKYFKSPDTMARAHAGVRAYRDSWNGQKFASKQAYDDHYREKMRKDLSFKG